jgi:hypothetical protein
MGDRRVTEVTEGHRGSQRNTREHRGMHGAYVMNEIKKIENKIKILILNW